MIVITFESELQLIVQRQLATISNSGGISALPYYSRQKRNVALIPLLVLAWAPSTNLHGYFSFFSCWRRAAVYLMNFEKTSKFFLVLTQTTWILIQPTTPLT